jgi:hypothetical protein
MQKRKPLASNAALLAALMLSGQNIAFADKGGSGPHHAAIPNVNLGLSAIPNQVTAPGAARSASSAGLMPPGQSDQPNHGESGKKSGHDKKQRASLTGTSTDETSVPEISPSQLPTCR